MRALFALLLLAGCATQTTQRNPDSNIPNGTWSGMFEYSGMTPDRSKHNATISFVVVSCGGEAKYWVNGGGGTFESPEANFQVGSYHGTHVISFRAKDSGEQLGWVELQSLTIIETGLSNASFQWTRSVSNRDLDVGESDRTFFQHGTGVFEHARAECSKDQISAIAASAIAAMPPNNSFKLTPAAQLN